MKRSAALFLFVFPMGITVDISIALSRVPDIHIRYQFSGPHSRRSEITLENKWLFKLSTEGPGDAPVCHSRALTNADILALVKRDGILKMRPTTDDSDYICEGSRSVFMKVDDRFIRLHEACKHRKGKADTAVDLAMDSLSNYLSGLVERDNAICPDVL